MRRNLFLDVVRGVLAWTVVFVHLLWFSGLRHSGARGAIGCWAVDAFMMLAGYVAVSAYRPEPYLRYLKKRAGRILPVYLVCWALALLVGSGLDTAWFITLLIQFYLVFPFLMKAIERCGKQVLLWLLALSLVCHLPPVRDSVEWFAPMYEFLPVNLLWFVLGMIAFYMVDHRVMDKLSTAVEERWFLIGLGKMSYSTYLVHWPVLFVIGSMIPSGWPMCLKFILITYIGVPVTALASLVIYAAIELPKPAIRDENPVKKERANKLEQPKVNQRARIQEKTHLCERAIQLDHTPVP